MRFSEYLIPTMLIRDHMVAVPLDWSKPDGATIDVFAREIVDPARRSEDLPILCFLQGLLLQQAALHQQIGCIGLASAGRLDHLARIAVTLRDSGLNQLIKKSLQLGTFLRAHGVS